MTQHTVKNPDESEAEASRRTAVEQLNERSQPYYDTQREHPVILRKKDGWRSIGKRDYLKRTWYVQYARCWLADSGCEIETISQATKLDRMESGRYTNLGDDEVEPMFDEAKEENLKWMKANSPHIPYGGEGGVNVYVDGEWMQNKLSTEENAVEVGDDWPEPDIRVRVAYTEEGLRHVGATLDEKTIPCERVDTADAKAAFEPEPDDYNFRIELRVDSEYTDPHA